MPQNFMLYWRPETVDSHLNENYLLNHAGSNQLNRVSAGDVLWIVTTGEADELGLAGRLKVGSVVSLAEAKRRLGRSDLWSSDYHALAAPGTARRMCGVGLLDIAHELRFVDPGANRLLLNPHGGVDPGQLRLMRILDDRSAALLSEAFNGFQSI